MKRDRDGFSVWRRRFSGTTAALAGVAVAAITTIAAMAEFASTANFGVITKSASAMDAEQSPAARRGDLVFSEDFDDAAAMDRWQIDGNPNVSLVKPSEDTDRKENTTNRTAWIRVEAPADGERKTENASVRIPFSDKWIRNLAGYRLLCRAQVKATGVTEPPKPYHGVKVMLHFSSPSGDEWLQQNDVYGTFDWKTLQFIASVPTDATAAELILGLELVHGTALFDDIEITVYKEPIARPAEPVAGQGPHGTAYVGHDRERLRGAMIGGVNAADLTEFGTLWNANHVRWQLIWNGFPHSEADTATAQEYDEWLEGQLERLDQLLPVCESAGILVLIDLHTPPGGRMQQDSVCQIFQRSEDQEHFLRVWDKISKRYVGNRTVWGYDLVNEPVEGIVPPELMDWEELAAAAARVIRQNDPDHAIIYEPAPWGAPDGLRWTKPLPADISGVVYSVHLYSPHSFTHQGVYNNPKPVMYPGKIGNEYWDRERLRQELQPVIDFQRNYNVHIYIGEFSAIRWAPGDSAYDYLRDCIELFEEYGWDWSYHAFREWDGWSVEHGEDPDDHQRTATPTKRKELMLKWFKKNKAAIGE